MRRAAERRSERLRRGSAYVPRRGDFIHLDFTPQAGAEMAGPHYGLVLSAHAFNLGTGLCMVCPVTSKEKLGGFDLAIPRDPARRVRGVVVSSELRTVDYQARGVAHAERAPAPLTDAAIRNVCKVLGVTLPNPLVPAPSASS